MADDSPPGILPYQQDVPFDSEDDGAGEQQDGNTADVFSDGNKPGNSDSENDSDTSDDPEPRQYRLARMIVNDFAEPGQDAEIVAPTDVERSFEDLQATIRTLDAAQWVRVFEGGFMRRLLDCIFDADFCGSPARIVRAWRDKTQSRPFSARYAALILHVFGECCIELHLLLTATDSLRKEWVDKYRPTLDSAALEAVERSSQLWQLAFEFRESLLSDAYESITYPVGDARNTCTQLAVIAQYVLNLREHFEFPLTYTHVDEEVVLLLLWLRRAGSEPRLARQALAALAPLLWHKTEKERQDLFCRRVIPESTNLPALNLAFSKHYKVESWHGRDVFAMLWIHALITGNLQRRDQTIDVLDYTTISCALAACLRQLCRGDSSEQDTWVLSAAHFFMTMPLNQCFSQKPAKYKEWFALSLAVTLFAAFPNTILNPLYPGDDKPVLYFLDITQACLLMFGFYKDSPRTRTVSPALNMLRRYTLQRGEDVLEEARVHPVTGNEKWSSTLSKLRKLVGLLPRPTHGSTEEETRRVASLKRCAWEKCCCHVFKPTHRMRVCAGCYTVAYCGEKCRERDWTNGGHSGQCRRLTHA